MSKNKKPEPQDLPEMRGPGVAPLVIKSVEAAAKRFIMADDELKEVKETHEAAKLALEQEMREHADELGRDAEGVIRYYCDDLCISVEPGKAKIKVKANGTVEDPDNENN